MGDRENFILGMYSASWANVTRAEDAIWKGMAAYTAVFVGLAVAGSVIGIWGFLNLVVLFGLFGMALSQNANLWFVRNMGMISNIEKEFLAPDDYDRLIPGKWKSKTPYWNLEIWWIMTAFFLAVSVASTVLIGLTLTWSQVAVTVVLFAIGVLLVAVYACRLAGRHQRFIDRAPGKS